MKTRYHCRWRAHWYWKQILLINNWFQHEVNVTQRLLICLRKKFLLWTSPQWQIQYSRLAFLLHCWNFKWKTSSHIQTLCKYSTRYQIKFIEYLLKQSNSDASIFESFVFLSRFVIDRIHFQSEFVFLRSFWKYDYGAVFHLINSRLRVR